MSSQLNQSSQQSVRANELDDARIESNSIVFTPQIKKQRTVSQTQSVSSRQQQKRRAEKRAPIPSENSNDSLRKLDEELQRELERAEKMGFGSQHRPVSKCKSIKLTQTVTVKKLRQAMLHEQICSICLCPPSSDVGQLPCGHKFCFQCIDFCARDTSSKCPYCRKPFTSILRNGTHIQIAPKQLHIEYQQDFIEDPCYICNTFESIPTLLLCDLCQNRCCHIECDPRIENDEIPEIWKCRFCEILELSQQMSGLDVTSNDNYRETTGRELDETEEIQKSEPEEERYQLRRNGRERRKERGGIAMRTRSKRTGVQESPMHLQRGLMLTRQAARRRRN